MKKVISMIGVAVAATLSILVFGVDAASAAPACAPYQSAAQCDGIGG